MTEKQRDHLKEEMMDIRVYFNSKKYAKSSLLRTEFGLFEDNSDPSWPGTHCRKFELEPMIGDLTPFKSIVKKISKDTRIAGASVIVGVTHWKLTPPKNGEIITDQNITVITQGSIYIVWGKNILDVINFYLMATGNQIKPFPVEWTKYQGIIPYAGYRVHLGKILIDTAFAISEAISKLIRRIIGFFTLKVNWAKVQFKALVAYARKNK